MGLNLRYIINATPNKKGCNGYCGRHKSQVKKN